MDPNLYRAFPFRDNEDACLWNLISKIEWSEFK